MYVRFWQNLDSIDCLLGGLEISILLMQLRFCQHLDSATCSLGGLPDPDLICVRKVLVEC